MHRIKNSFNKNYIQMKQYKIILYLMAFIIFAFSCNQSNKHDVKKQEENKKGKLFIIGGGKRHKALMDSLIKISGVDTTGYVIVLPMSSSIPDTIGWEMEKEFQNLGIENVKAYNIDSTFTINQQVADSLANARLIYISGGDQSKFMKDISNKNVKQLIHKAYDNGATIAGTSAGAALMSKEMITGNEFKHPEYTGYFRTIEANNIELIQGLALLPNAIIDQHFVKRMRMNRLISVSLENPNIYAIGIDESTAMLYDNKKAKVYGKGQIIILKHQQAETKVINGMLGGKDLSMSIYLPGDSFKLN